MLSSYAILLIIILYNVIELLQFIKKIYEMNDMPESIT